MFSWTDLRPLCYCFALLWVARCVSPQTTAHVVDLPSDEGSSDTRPISIGIMPGILPRTSILGKATDGRFDEKDAVATRASFLASLRHNFPNIREEFESNSMPSLVVRLRNHVLAPGIGVLAEFEITMMVNADHSCGHTLILAGEGKRVDDLKDGVTRAVLRYTRSAMQACLSGETAMVFPEGSNQKVRRYSDIGSAIESLPRHWPKMECSFFQNTPYGPQCVAYRQIAGPPIDWKLGLNAPDETREPVIPP